MSEINKLKSLINLIGVDENFSCNVSINSKLEANALKELKEFQTFRSAEGYTAVTKTFDELLLCPKACTNEQNTWTYATAIFEILLHINEYLEHFVEFPLSINDARKLHNGIRKSIEYGLKPYLLKMSIPIDSRLPYIITSTKVLLKLVNNKFFPLICTRGNQHLVYTDLVSSIFLILSDADGELKSKFEQHLYGVQSKLSHSDYFKILFLIMGSCKNNAGSAILQIVHTQLMQTLHRPGSFVALCEALLPPITSLEQDEEIMKKRLHACATISSIIGKRGHGNQFYHQIIEEIFDHLLSHVKGNKSNQAVFIDAAVQSLRKLYLLRLTYIQRHLSQNLFGAIDQMSKPNDLIAGAIVCDANQFTNSIHLIHLTFCTTGPDAVPSELLTPFMPLFIQIYYILNESKNKLLKNELLAVIIRCLSNRNKAELNQIIKMVLFEEYAENTRYLHTRIKAERIDVDESDGLEFSIAPIDLNENSTKNFADLEINTFLRSSLSMVNVLKQSNHNTLIYNAFLYILELLSDNFGIAENTEDKPSYNNEFIGSECEFRNAIEIKFKKKYAIINALNELILFKQFHGQFAENSEDLFAIFNRMLLQQIKQIKMHRCNENSLPNNIQEILVVILLCISEFMERMKNDDLKAQLMQTLENLKIQLQTDQIRLDVTWKNVLRHLDSLLNNDHIHSNRSEFTKFKHILSDSSSEPYTIVYAIMNLIKLIGVKDEETVSNSHVLLALSLKLLKEADDSYIFLNCIKLLIALFDILGDTVLDTLIAEYHFDIDSDAADMDFKLKIGETIVKVIQGLGEMCFNYKDLLLNCFLKGIYNKNDEFRTSNISNLGVVLRILSYQVHHFFHEIILAVQNTLLYDKYLPTRRASALLLADLLKGMQNLEQYQEFLLPMYRSLKEIADNDPDLHMQIHARNGLEYLKENVKEALTPKMKMEKEINIFDIKR